MIKILVKAAVLVGIILSIYFIVNPSACSNLISGRAVNSTEELPTFVPNNDKSHSELLVPQGDKGTQPSTQENTVVPQTVTTTPAESTQTTQDTTPVITDTNSAVAATPATQEPEAKGFTQADIDYAIASRYVELENEYLAKKKDVKNAAKEISYIVMDDFELTPAEWEAFLQRATVDNLFEKVRQQQSAQ